MIDKLQIHQYVRRESGVNEKQRIIVEKLYQLN